MYVTHLGVLDLGDAGLESEHTVGIFDAAGDLVVSTTIAAGLSGDLMTGSMIYDTVDIAALARVRRTTSSPTTGPPTTTPGAMRP